MMKKKIRILLFSIVATLWQLPVNGAAMGQWKAYMAYQDITEIEKADHLIYVLASDNLYSYNPNDQSIQTYDKVNALSDCSIAHIAWNQQAKQLVIVYKNNNIDLLDEKGRIVNVSDYYNKSIIGDKNIYSIDMSGAYAYISTGFGLMKFNVKDAEISDTYNLGFRVDYSYLDNQYIYAASSTEGLYRAAQSQNLLDKKNWSRVGDYTAREKTLDPDLLNLAKTLDPGGPKYNTHGFLRFKNGQLYSTDNTESTKIACLQQYDPKTDTWLNYENDLEQRLGHRFVKIFNMDVDPNDPNHVFAASRSGLYEYRNGAFVKEYTNNNSPLQTASTVGNNNKNYVVVSSSTFDTAGNLWLFNSISPSTPLWELTKDGQWKDHSKKIFMQYEDRSLEQIEGMMMDSRQIIWFVNNFYRTPSLLCYQPSTDGSYRYNQFINEDGTRVKTEYVRCVAEDKSGNIWMGTNMGPLMLASDDIGTDPNEVVFQQIKVPRNDGTNYADYLLAGVDISCIAIDGAGRKWFGTNGIGAYLISEDNMTQLQHFTTSNSSLLSNTIRSIAINDKTGEVFFGSDEGLCSYMGDATATNEEMNTDNVYAYPNPVRPGYTGLITITGLSYNADVKIVTTNGVLVAQGRSNGGTFTWDGNDLNGKRVASGVYMVETATQDGDSGTVCKIAVVN